MPPADPINILLHPGEHINILPNMAFLFDDLNLVALIQPRFFGVESGKMSPRHNGAEREFEKVARLYHHVKHSERAMFMAFGGGHEVSVSNVMPLLNRWMQSAVPD